VGPDRHRPPGARLDGFGLDAATIAVQHGVAERFAARAIAGLA